jgi:HD-GYP domain-containing protein (c-di-GMP phosphodiesterase class II)
VVEAPGLAKVRLAEVVALLSLGTDLGLGQPMEHMIRACLLALRLADRLGFDDGERGTLYYSGLLAWVGCHTDAYEQAKWFGDDLSLKRDAHYGYDFGRSRQAAAFMLRNVGGPGRPLVERARVGVAFLGDGRRAIESLAENHYRATDELALRLRLSDEVRESLRQSYERWDGKGPYKLKGEEVALSSRLMNLADVVEVFQRTRGLEAAIGVARERSGTQFDPALVELFCERAPALFEELDSATGWAAVIDAEPSLGRELSEEEVDEALAAVGVFAELKSPWTMGHAAGVAALCAAVIDEVGLAAPEAALLRKASYVHDLGRLGVSNAIWDKRGPLSPSEVERVRLHPYLSERMLSFSSALAPIGALAVQHHERLDGSGYPRGLSGGMITPAARLLAAADVYQALTEPRPHRPARTREEAADIVRAEVSEGRLDSDAAGAVLRAAGHPVPRRRQGPMGLTAREVEVLRLLARGLSNKEIAQQLVISPKTAGSHVENIYAKAGASNRAQASLFAVKHGLLADAYP